MRSVRDDPDGYMRGDLWWQQARGDRPPLRDANLPTSDPLHDEREDDDDA